MKRFFTRTAAKIARIFWSWGFLKFILWTVTLVILFYVEEDWRGARAWAATKAKWEAKGESFDLNHFIPPPIPDDQNLAALAIFKMEPDPDPEDKGTLVPLKLRKALDEDEHGGKLPTTNATTVELRTGLAMAYSRAFPGKKPPADMLAQLEALYPIIPELRAAAAVRPYCRFNQDYAAQPPRSFWLLNTQITLSKRLCLHAVIALEESQPQVALDDLKINYRLAPGVGRDPSLVAGLVDIGITAIAGQVVEDGLSWHVWNDAQLTDLQSELAKIDFLSQYQFTWRGEIITETIPNYDYIKTLATRKWAAISLLYGLYPVGWLDLDKCKMTDFLFNELKSIDPQSRRVFPNISREIAREADRTQALPWRLAPWNLFFTISAPIFTKQSNKFALAQVWRIDESRIACALERYRLAHGDYPGSLDALAPACIDEVPHDIMNGGPYHYRLRPDGTFLLYSIGWNQTDDGGKVVYDKDNPNRIDFNDGDWVWPTPQIAPQKTSL